jgi:replicative DNA helicase
MTEATNTANFEDAVLGAIMLEHSAIAEVRHLRPEMFLHDGNRWIFQAIQNLDRKGEPIDLLTVIQELRASDKLKAAGGPIRLTECTNGVASAAHITYHSRHIAERWLNHALRNACLTTIRDCEDPTNDVFTLKERHEIRLREMEGKIRRGSEAASMSELADEMDVFLDEVEMGMHTGISGLPARFARVNAMTGGWQKSDLIICGARPSMGKTSFVLDQAIFSAQRGTRVLFLSLEMHRKSISQRIACRLGEVDSTRIRNGTLTADDRARLRKATALIRRLPITIDDRAGLSEHEVRNAVRSAREAYDGDLLVIIDYIQLMSFSGNAGNRQLELTAISRSLKETAKDFDVPLIALSQLNRESDKIGKGGGKPKLSDLRDSGAIEQDADIVFFLHRPGYYGLTRLEDGTSTEGLAEIIFAKQRNGPVGEVRASFSPKLQIWDEFGYGDHIEPPATQITAPPPKPQAKPRPHAGGKGAAKSSIRPLTSEERGGDPPPPPEPPSPRLKDVPF